MKTKKEHKSIPLTEHEHKWGPTYLGATFEQCKTCWQVRHKPLYPDLVDNLPPHERYRRVSMGDEHNLREGIKNIATFNDREKCIEIARKLNERDRLLAVCKAAEAYLHGPRPGDTYHSDVWGILQSAIKDAEAANG